MVAIAERIPNLEIQKTRQLNRFLRRKGFTSSSSLGVELRNRAESVVGYIFLAKKISNNDLLGMHDRNDNEALDRLSKADKRRLENLLNNRGRKKDKVNANSGGNGSLASGPKKWG